MRKNRLISIILSLTLLISLILPADICADTEGLAERTILLYICGADLESEAALATHNLSQVLRAGFSRNNDVRIVVMTGGSEYWWIKETDCVIPESIRIDDFYDTTYNRLWEAKGADADEDPGKLVLLDADGVTGDGEDAKPAWEETMSDPETLKKFIEFGVENYPANKYDLILWNHGGGPVDGFAYDEYSEDGMMMSLPQIMDAVSDNAVTSNGGKFDFIDFDACLMSSTEILLALGGYTDYYIASAETEPGEGQDYYGWLNKLGEDPAIDTFVLGTHIVDDFIDYYKDEQGNETGIGTLAVVDMNRLAAAGFAEAFLRLTGVLTEQLNTADENNEYLYYDELDSAKRSIKYALPDTYYKDLGNLVGQLAVTNKEISEHNIDESGNYTKLNDYAEASSEILSILGDAQIIYSKYTDNLIADPEIQIDADKNLTYQNLAPTGMNIYYPAINDSDYSIDYLYAVRDTLQYIKNENAKEALSEYSRFIAQQSLMTGIGFYVDFMLDAKSISPEEIDYDSVKANINGEFHDSGTTIWDETMAPLIDFYSNEEEARTWLDDIIKQQVSDHVQPDNISVHTNAGKNCYKVQIENTSKRAVDNVKAKVIAELPAAKEYLENTLSLTYFAIYHPEWVECCIRTIDGIQDMSSMKVDYATDSIDTILNKYITWYAEKTSTWNLEDTDKKVYALQDAEGNIHAAQVVELDEDRLLAYIMYPNTETGKTDYGYLLFEPDGDGYALSNIALNMNSGRVRLIPVNELTKEVSDIVTAYEVDIYVLPFTLVPMTENAFSITAENAGSVKLVLKDINEVPDIRDTDNDGDPLSRRIVVSSIYQYDTDITDKDRIEDLIDVKDLSAESVIYNGKEQGPKVTCGGKVLEEDEDYVWYKKDDSLVHKKIGKYSVTLIGQGNYIGRDEKTYRILYKDVPETHSYQEAVYWVSDNGIAAGYTGDKLGYFGVSDNITRGQVVMLLWRMAGKPKPGGKGKEFSDVPKSNNFHDAIMWASEKGIAAGYKNGKFGIGDPCTRGQIVMFLWRYKGKPAAKAGAKTFKDVPKSSGFYNAIMWASSYGITAGYGDGSFKPNNECTRGQMSTFLYRMEKKL